jgi:hypothetical protein
VRQITSKRKGCHRKDLKHIYEADGHVQAVVLSAIYVVM